MNIFDIFSQKEQESLPKCSCVIVAAGSSSRMGVDKLMLPICGIPVIIRSALAFQNSSLISEIVIVTKSESIVDIAKLCDSYSISKVTQIISGGANRTESSLLGLSSIDKESELVAIHDGARPLVTSEIIEKAFFGAYKNKAAVPCVPVKDTIKVVKDSKSERTLDRSLLYAAQTPQVFHPHLIIGALTDARDKGIEYTDDGMALEAFGVYSEITEGSYENIKITVPQDVAIAEYILENR